MRRYGRYTLAQLESTRQQMIKIGYKETTNDDVFVYRTVGEKVYMQLLDSASRFSEFECQEWMLERGTEGYQLIQKANKCNLMMQVANMIQKNNPSEFFWRPAPDGVMKLEAKLKSAYPLEKELAQGL